MKNKEGDFIWYELMTYHAAPARSGVGRFAFVADLQRATFALVGARQ
jgi:hypothetical protein